MGSGLRTETVSEDVNAVWEEVNSGTEDRSPSLTPGGARRCEAG